MKILNAYFIGFNSAVKLKKMATVIYPVIFLLALIIAVPFHSALLNQAGNTMELQPLLKQFNFTVYADFMNSSGKIVKALIPAAIWMGIFYSLFTVFFTGGILNVLKDESLKFSAGNFFSGCGKYFFRYLRMGIYLLIVQILIGVIVFLPLSLILASNYETTLNEASLFYIFVTGVIIYLLLFILVLIIGDYAKIILYNNDSKKVIKSIYSAFKFTFRHLFGIYLLYILILATPVLLFVIYFLLDNTIGMVSGFTIFVMFIIQQAFIWLRVLVKVWFLGSELTFYSLINAEAGHPIGTSATSLQINGEQTAENPLPV